MVYFPALIVKIKSGFPIRKKDTFKIFRLAKYSCVYMSYQAYAFCGALNSPLPSGLINMGDTSIFDHFGPFCNFGLNKFVEFFWRTADRFGTLL